MNLITKCLAGKCLAGLAIVICAFGQNPEPAPAPVPPGDLKELGAELKSQMDALKAQMPDLKDMRLDLQNMNLDIENMNLKDMALLGSKIQMDPAIAALKDHAALLQSHVHAGEGDREYESGTRALDNRRFDEAIERFDRVIANKGSRADGALYWRAYALNRLGRRDDALAALAQLKQQFPNSPWVKDGQALEVEVRQSNGKPVPPAQEANDDLKLMAINGLMNADPERAIPLLEGVLKGASSPEVKDRALFVLTQSHSPQARTVLMEFARGAGNPDLQERAIRYVGMTGTPESRQELARIYAASSDVNAKRAILRSLNPSESADTLFEIAKNEKNPDLRRLALRQLAISGNTAQAAQLYGSEQSPENKDEIINGLFMRHDAKTMVQLARKENDPERKKYIVSRLAMMRNNKEAADYMMELLK